MAEEQQSSHPVGNHPKPEPGPVNSLNEMARRELWYLDTVVATPFRAIRRNLGSRPSAWAQSADEVVCAMEGMARLPVKLLQSAFGEEFKKNTNSNTQTH
jgi:hypothetical protein